MRQAFERIYRSGRWVKGSGWGSWLENVGPYVDFLQAFLDKHHDIETVLDIGCGDWEFSQYIDWDGRSYLGVDVVPFIVEANSEKFTTGYIHFVAGDATQMDFEPADLILVKDVFMHWSTSWIRRFLKNAPPYKYMLVTNDWRPEDINGDTKVGRFQSVDLNLPPYNLEAQEVLTWKVPHPKKDWIQTKKTFLLRGKGHV